MNLSLTTALILVLLFVDHSHSTSHRFRRNKLRSRDSRSFPHSRTDHASSSCNDGGGGFSSKRKIVCYYRVEENFRPYDLDPCLCTHVVYSYVAIRDNFAFIAGKKGDLKFLASLKHQNPLLKVLVSVRPADKTFTLESNSTAVAANVKSKFAKRLRDFLSRHNVDGVDLDWEFFRENDRSANGREALVSLVRVLRATLRQPVAGSSDGSFLITLTSSKFPRDLTDNYDFSNLHKFVDFVNVPAFSFDSQGKAVRHPARLHGISDMENMDSLVDLAIALGLPHEQMVVGVPAHGILYKLMNTSQTTPGSPAIPWNYNDAIISHSKICSIRDAGNWTMVREKDLTAPYIFNKDKWIGFDDEISIKLKAKYIALRNLGGIAFWSPNDDDPTGKCGFGAYPLLQTIKYVLAKDQMHGFNNTRSISGSNSSLSSSRKSALSSFVAVIEKYGNVERVTDEELGETPVPLPCSKEGYLKHPKDCSRFYRCLKFDEQESGVSKFQYACPPGLVFDETHEVCNWPSWSATCAGSGEIVQVVKNKFSCPNYGYFQDPTDCAYFYYCSDFGKGQFQPYEFKCPFDLAFDEEKLLCNWKWLVKGCKEAVKADTTESTAFSRQFDALTGDMDPASQGLGGESDELMEKRSDDSDDVTFVDKMPVEHRASESLSRPEGRKGFARSVKDAVSGAIDSVNSKVKSLLGYEEQQQQKSDKRQDIGIDPVFLAEESIISNIFSGINPFGNSLEKGKSVSKSSIKETAAKLAGKDQFISIPIIEVSPGRGRKSGRPRNTAKIPHEPQPQRRPLAPEEQHGHRGNKVSGGRIVQHPPVIRVTQKPQRFHSSPRPTDKPFKSPDLIPVPILTLRQTPRPDHIPAAGVRRPPINQKVKEKESRRVQGPARPHARPEPEPKPLTRKPRPEPEPEPLREQQRRPASHNRLVHDQPPHRPPQRPKHPRPEPERAESVRHSSQREPHRQTGIRREPSPPERPEHVRPDHVRVPTGNRHPEQRIPVGHRPEHEIRAEPGRPQKRPAPHPEHILNPQAQPSTNFQRREPPPHRVNHVQPKSKPRKQAHQHHSISSISAQLPAELYANYDIDIKPLAVHPIISPHGQLDYAQLSLVPMDPASAEAPQTRKPSGKPFGMPSMNGPRVHVTEKHTHRPLPQPPGAPVKHPQVIPLRPAPREPVFGPPRRPAQPQPAVDITELHIEPHSLNRPVEYNVDPHINAFKDSVLYNAAVLQQHLNGQHQQLPQHPQTDPSPPRPEKPTLAPQHPGYTAQYQPHASGSHVYHHYQNQLPEKQLAPPLSHAAMSQTMTKNGFKPISPQYGFAAPQHSVSQSLPSSHYQFSALSYGTRQPTTASPVTSSAYFWPETFAPPQPTVTGRTTKSSLLIIPVPDSHYKADSLNDVIRISKDYPQMFPQGFDFGKVAAMTRTKSDESPAASVYYESGFGAKNDTKADYIILTVNDDESTIQPPASTERPSDIHIFTKSPATGYEKKASTTSPVVIKLEIPEGKPEIVKTIVDQVKETLVKAPAASSQSPLHVSIKSTTISPSGNSAAPSTGGHQDSVFGNKNIPQSLYDSIQQVIATHLLQQLSKDITTTTTTTTTSSTTTTSTTTSTTTESPAISVEVDDITTFQPTVTESTASTAAHALYEHMSGAGHYFNVSDPNAQAGSWPYQPWFQPPVYPNPYYPQPVYAHPSLNQTNQYFPYPQYPYGQWQAPANNYSNAFAGWYEWAYGQNPSAPLPAASTINETVVATSKLPSSYFVTITTTVAPPTSVPVATTLPTISTTTPHPTTIHVKEIERITTKHFVPETKVPSTSTSAGEPFDILRTKATQAPEAPQIQVYIVQGPNGPKVETKTVNSKDGQKQPNVQVYVIDENSKKPYQYGVQSGGQTRSPDTLKPQGNPYYQYAHSNYQPEESQIRIQTTMAPANTDGLYVKEDAYENKYNSYRDLEYEDEDGVAETRSPHNQFLPSSKMQSLQNIYNSQSYPGLRNFTDGSVPESACTRPGLFQHPNDCNKFYECYFDRFVNKFTLHLFECPVKLAFDSRIVGCSGPTDPTVCVQY